jgi:hypothetical protein
VVVRVWGGGSGGGERVDLFVCGLYLLIT